MRNPAPLVLSLGLGLVALILILRQPAAEPASAETPAEPAAEKTPPAPPEATPDETATAASPTVEPHPWPHEKSDIPADEKLTFGHLDNGMRYLIRPNAEPPGRVSLRLHIAAGSLMEDEDQQGLAHFLEHMVFNGTKNFTPAELVPRMQRLGIAFGAHANAYTSFDETVYMLDLPDLEEETLDLCFTVMRDFCDGALLKEEEIDKERGVILAEMTSRDSVGYRLMKQQFSTLAPDSLVTRRFPIGETEVIKNAPRERFVEFYNDYYIPRRMTFVVVGDVDPAAIEERIDATFGSLANPEQAGADPELGEITANEGVEPAVFSDKEVTGDELSLLSIRTWEPQLDTVERRREQLPLQIAHSILGLRFDRLAKQEDSPITGGYASRSELFNHLELASVNVEAAVDRWQDAVPLLEQEFRRAREHGFTAAEFVEARARLLNAYQLAVRGEETRQSPPLATAIARDLRGHDVLSSPSTDLQLLDEAIDELDADSCHQAFLDFWRDRGLHLVLTTRTETPETLATLERVYQESSETEVEPPEETEIQEFAYTDFGEPGAVASREEIDDLGVTRLTLDNGIVVHLKPTDFENNRIRLRAVVGHGRLTLSREQPGLDRAAAAVLAEGGLAEHTSVELRQIFAGRNVGYGFTIEDDHFALSGTTTPEDLELQLQAMTAQILEPGYRPEALSQFRRSLPGLYQQLRHTAAGPMNRMRTWLRGGDPRFTLPMDPEVLRGYELDDVRQWIAREFTGGEIELSIVGDFDPETLEPLLLATFGAIDERPGGSELDPEARVVERPEAPATRELGYESRIAQGNSLVFWKTFGPRENPRRFRRLRVLAAILDDRLREDIREELGAAYSPQAAADGSPALQDYGYLLAICTAEPDKLELLRERSLALGSELSDGGAEADELDRALQPMLTEIRQMQRSNAYWLNSVMSGASRDERSFELARDAEDDLASITLEEINQLASDYLLEDKALQVLIRAEEESDDETDDDAAEPDPDAAEDAE